MNFFSEYTALYFFSALLQANAAIVAIVGVFFIFRIQSLKSVIEYLKGGVTFPLGRDNRTGFTPKDVLEFEKKTIAEKDNYIKVCKHRDKNIILPFLERWVNNEKNIENIKEYIILPTFLLAIGIIINSFGLFFANFIHYYLFANEFIILLIFLIYQIFIIFFVIKAIFKALEIKNKRKNQ